MHNAMLALLRDPFTFTSIKESFKKESLSPSSSPSGDTSTTA
jgi:hypothetical protein